MNTEQQHAVKTETRIHNFKEVQSMFDTWTGGMQIFGQADTVTEFTQSIQLESQWNAYGYELKFIVRQPNSKNMTAILYRNPAQ